MSTLFTQWSAYNEDEYDPVAKKKEAHCVLYSTCANVFFSFFFLGGGIVGLASSCVYYLPLLYWCVTCRSSSSAVAVGTWSGVVFIKKMPLQFPFVIILPDQVPFKMLVMLSSSEEPNNQWLGPRCQ